MKVLQKLFGAGYIAVAVFFLVCGIALVGMAAWEIWEALTAAVDAETPPRFVRILECIGLLTIAVASFELGQTVLEEEVQREASISTPTRVRRFLSRFLVVVVVSLSIECLVSAFQSLHGHPELLPHAGVIGLCAAGLLVAWGIFVRLNIPAEHLEPQAMQEAQEEDKHIST
ncbi:hypothetical protein OU994_10040 [Pseudoduganella sp. SL102]|uniref:hypothetical protein n=1 Tax=Pseudoduganella sp. SL102 TaxID=2995154 RepID=UPI00248C795B|nr:hypothetical protein [Pseudoduganella sp. SL102]WBS04588.1 hypothetical protein OU994_10040 [Pseudoduganella sp. SL102]